MNATRKPQQTCLEEGGPTHAYQSTGLDTRGDGVLVNTRRCVWCGQQQTKPYGAGGRRGWTTVKRRQILDGGAA